jgi:hypothetical protein
LSIGFSADFDRGQKKEAKMKTMLGYVIGAAIAWLLAGSPVQADI